MSIGSRRQMARWPRNFGDANVAHHERRTIRRPQSPTRSPFSMRTRQSQHTSAQRCTDDNLNGLAKYSVRHDGRTRSSINAVAAPAW